MKRGALYGVLALIGIAGLGSWAVVAEDERVASCEELASRQSEASDRLNMLKVRQQVLSSERRIIARLERLAPQSGIGMSSPELAALATANEGYLAQMESEGKEMQRGIAELCDDATKRRRALLLIQLILTTMAAAAGFWVGSVKDA